MSRFNFATTLFLLVASAVPAARAEPINDFAVFGNTGVTYNGNVSGGLVGSNGDVSIGVFSTLVGGAGGGSLNVAGGFDTINGPVSFNHDVTLGTFGTVNGNVAAGGNVSVAGSATVNGNINYGGSLSTGFFSHISGTTTHTPGITPFSGAAVPAADKFTSGGSNVNVPTFGSSTLAPGSYGALTLGTSPFGSSTLTLTAGNYYFDSITSNGAFNNLNLDLTNGPVHIFVTGDVNLGGAFTTEVNGANPTAGMNSLASNVLLETRGNFNGSGFFTTDLFFGTIFAPNGNITTGFDSNIVGSLLAGGAINSSSTNVTGVPYSGFGTSPTAVPEPSSLLLLSIPALGLAIYRRRRNAA